jgi:hypothetical protein
MVVDDNVSTGIDDEAEQSATTRCSGARRGKWLLKKAPKEQVEARAAGLRENGAAIVLAAVCRCRSDPFRCFVPVSPRAGSAEPRC